MKATSDELLHFVAVVDCGSISAAAEQLHLTPSAISRSLARLEGKLATTLLNRTTRRMELTEEGRFFLDQARDILQRMDSLEERLALRRQRPAGRLRVNAASPFMLHAVVPHVGAFRALYPDIQLELNTNDQIIDLLEQRTDVAIRIGPLGDSSLHARPLGASRLHLLASPDYLARQGRPERVEDLAGHSLLGFTQPESLNLWPLRHAGGEQWRITPSLSASSGETLRQLALAGEGIACLASFMSDRDLAEGRLVKLLGEAMSDYRQPIHAVYYRNTQLALRIQCFLDFLQARLAG
ncbi:LysR substrate-binding domain-containing protein [Metapseudomonas otitidis]|uniref:Transcriptional regulator n=1 Tax=Metapseudomonas otitidis TaxID=319939 RepID=A0A1I0UUA9_9GAMM|nr:MULTISPECIES: LysR family transcriptional regulator [Pseudomonas]MBO2928802.1 LysR family transcriptional regulator [Pseudomonas otitidis]MCO7557887.1 LysR family transcriptional regulator [Pseudomonas otitidis]MCP1620083.1 DNA-binding transcriptional LysR family regulator [Pseudomonas otitidis]MDG9782162.1 LysR family transcriptional regulator [Pseudomonas otitidis]MDH0334309.1 LysR family transcriptional regulator [Pseudomonas otitidis]